VVIVAQVAGEDEVAVVTAVEATTSHRIPETQIVRPGEGHRTAVTRHFDETQTRIFHGAEVAVEMQTETADEMVTGDGDQGLVRDQMFGLTTSALGEDPPAVHLHQAVREARIVLKRDESRTEMEIRL
jgi:hypothetical protein